MSENTNIRLDELKQKYAKVFQAIDHQGISLTNVRLQDDKLFIQGAATGVEAKNAVLDEIKAVNPAWERDVTVDLRTEEEQPTRPHTGQTSVNNSPGIAQSDDVSKV